jgi:hypothetical protein
MASAAMWDFEGDDLLRGRRLLNAAFRLGITDGALYLDLNQYLKDMGCDDERLSLFSQLRDRWPKVAWIDSAYDSIVAPRSAKATDAARRCWMRVPRMFLPDSLISPSPPIER